jgi:hypothetical protein
MSIRFAAARPIGGSSISDFLIGRAPVAAANDNGRAVAETGGLLKAALRHFAEHGLSAAEQARKNAEEAFRANRNAEYHWWLAICTALDRKMAAAIEFHNLSAQK